jgi:hypothetical protein
MVQIRTLDHKLFEFTGSNYEQKVSFEYVNDKLEAIYCDPLYHAVPL